jgi:endonuclease/exonuclease/phosphatase family metal-dependent hydrolase
VPDRERAADARGDATGWFRLASFNIRSGLGWDGRRSWPWRRGALLRQILALDADVLALQEVHGFQLRYLLRALAPPRRAGRRRGLDSGYQSVGRPRGRWSGERSPILFRSDRFLLLETQTRWLSPTPRIPGSRFPGSSLPRAVTFARLRHRPSGATFVVANAHLDHRSSEMRRRSARLLARWVRGPEPVVLCGDFNETPQGPAVAHLEAACLRDAHSHLAQQGPTASTYHGFAGAHLGARIDLILLSGSWRSREARIVRLADPREAGSDHWPVSVMVSLALRAPARH